MVGERLPTCLVHLSPALGGEPAPIGECGLMNGDAALQFVEINGLPVAHSLARVRVVRRAVRSQKVAGILLLVPAGGGAKREALLSELTVQHPHMKPEPLAAGSRLLDRGRSAPVKANGSRKESGGEGEEAGHWSPGSAPARNLVRHAALH